LKTQVSSLEFEAEDVYSMDNIQEGSRIQCTNGDGVEYRSRPQLIATLPDKRKATLGAEISVRQRTGDWVRDTVGWLPLYQEHEDHSEENFLIVANLPLSPRQKRAAHDGSSAHRSLASFRDQKRRATIM
jgi:hypothetical protein